ncbi:MAG: mechanosensitive ion channel, partial [Gammaproteobacteria bacterium]|nr:mechanosensitive ion channel [Gammaproteobacteria bacterium]
VRSIGMRFIVIENSLGALVFIPNRSVTNVINYARGYVRCLVDVNLSKDLSTAEKMLKDIELLVETVVEQFPGIFIYPPSTEGRFPTAAGHEFVRIKFRIWPGRGGPIETTFKQNMLQMLKAIDANYQDWMVAIHYEVEQKIAK